MMGFNRGLEVLGMNPPVIGHGGYPPSIFMNIKRKDLQKGHFAID
jgi:hypothetical protein